MFINTKTIKEVELLNLDGIFPWASKPTPKNIESLSKAIKKALNEELFYLTPDNGANEPQIKNIILEGVREGYIRRLLIDLFYNYLPQLEVDV